MISVISSLKKISSNFAVIEEKAKLESGASSSTSSSPTKTEIELPKIATSEEKLQAVETIEDAFVDHQRRERALAGLKAKIHTARPWQKKKTSNAEEVVEESSEEELERAYR